MKIYVPERMGKCKEMLRQNLDSRFDLGMERHVGWVFACFFSLIYHSRQEIGLWHMLIYHKVVGILSPKNRGTNLYYVVFRGLSDPVSLLLLIAGFFLVIWIIWGTSGLRLRTCFYLAVAGAVLVAAGTWAASTFSVVGRQSYRRLKKTLRNITTNLRGA